jgi:hypothetical protein
VVAFPWRLVEHLPVFNNILPVRLMVYAALAAAVTVAMWAASAGPPRWLRVLLPALATVALVPNLGLPVWHRTPALPTFFGAGEYRDCIRRDDNVLVIPFGSSGEALLWQATSDFHFRMADGYLSPLIPKGFAGEPVMNLILNKVPFGEGGTVFGLARAKGVSTIVVDESDPWPWSSVLGEIRAPARVGGMLLYPVRADSLATSPRCG